ncbi:maestro heat-like repeat-containing protein family member 2B [Trachemys scripta elegans]|uniref:maestro heat-like repeat-containing protein family member 2B n=1 Tax=Trachemys scripta elegans TaxID=31138 RepID=UPI001551BE38|nr:maestro heat-like repeat-containing protein family member 2B [Trachemys scripta elegans]
MYLKLTLIQNVTEISCAILETSDSQEFEFSYKQELLGYMLDFIKKEPLDSLASPVRYKAILAIGHLSKLKPSLTLEENHELLDECFKSLFPLPPLEKMKEEGETAKDALHIQVRDNNSPLAPSTVFLPSRHWVMAVTHGLPGKVMVSFPRPTHTNDPC